MLNVRHVVLALVVPCFALEAQQNTGHVKGRVVHPRTGEALAFATVVLVATRDTAERHVVYADSAGTFSFDAIRPGSYRVAAQQQLGDSIRSPMLFDEVKVKRGKVATLALGAARGAGGNPACADNKNARSARGSVSDDAGRPIGNGAAELVRAPSDDGYHIVDRCRSAPGSERVPPV